MKEQRVRQSVCAVCRKTIRPGKGTVLNFGGGGRVHTLGCLQNAQRVTATSDRIAVERIPQDAITARETY